MSHKTLYCSVDLELSGFDPSKAEILEVGLVFFVLNSGKFKIVSEWTKVFKPKGSVPKNILGLTGISEDELVEAEDFQDSREFLSDKLKDAVLVGHNVSLDIRFLEAFGVTLSGKSIDTLDIAQIMLPTYHSYNLENLMHFFKISHRNAHRALADARASVKLLEKLMFIFHSFPNELKIEFSKKAKRAGFLWSELLEIEMKTNFKFKSDARKFNPRKKVVLPEQNCVVSLPFHIDPEHFIETSLIEDDRTRKNRQLYVLPDKRKVLDFVKRTRLSPLFLPEDTFSEKAYKKLKNSKLLSEQEVKFLLKVMVWHHTNWQTQTFKDLNVNFSGGQFLPLIAESKIRSKKENAIVCDYETFFEYSNDVGFKGFDATFVDLDTFEKELGKTIGEKVNWNRVIYTLKNIYNPDTGYGDSSFSKEVVAMLSATDLFFGLFVLYLKPLNTELAFIERDNIDGFLLSRIEKASIKYVEKLRKFALKSKSTQLLQQSDQIEVFFRKDPGIVKWVEYSSDYCSLFARNVDIRPNVAKYISKLGQKIFIDNGLTPILFDYYTKRLGLDEFSFLNKYKDNTVSTKIQFKPIKDRLSFVKSGKLPMVILFKTHTELKRFYEDNFDAIKKQANLLAQNITGGGTKLFRNFAIRFESIMLVTPEFVVKNSWARVIVSTILMDSLVEFKLKHPYDIRSSELLFELGVDFSKAKTENTRRLLMRVFFTNKLKDIIVFQK